MKILLVNNNTVHMDYLLEALAGHAVEVVDYEPGAKLDHQDKDLVILSGGGGEGLEINDKHRRRLWYQEQMEFVRSIDKPMLGICMGFEVISRAFGAPVKEMRRGLVHGYFKLDATPAGRQLLGQDELLQFKAHRWHVTQAPKNFEVLASSLDGIEIIRHKNRPILAVQFHPEKGGTLSVMTLVKSLT